MRTGIFRRALAICAVLAVATTSGAQLPDAPQSPQAPVSSKAVVIKGRAPVNEQVLRVKLPRPQQAVLPNGLRVIVLEDRRVPRITLDLRIPGAGGYYDPADLPGLATVTADMMREGTTSRSSSQISEQLETIAASVTVGAPPSAVEASVFGSSLTEHADKLLEIFADVLLNPSFPDQELERYKQRTRAMLIQQRSNPGFLGSERFASTIYGSHPAARVSIAPETLGKVTRQALADVHRSRFVPDHALLAVSGDISLAEARKLIGAHLSGWKRAGTPAPSVADPPPLGPTRVSFVARANSVQTNLMVGTQMIQRTDPDYDVLQVMNGVLGGGPTGRLFIILREEKGYTYGAYSGLVAGRWRGAWQASTSVRTEVTQEALRDLLAEIGRMRNEPVPEKEFNEKKRAMVGSFALSLENPQQMIGYYTEIWRNRLPADYWDKYPERIAAVTQAQVQAAAKKYLDPSRLHIVAVGEPAKIAEILKGFGPVEMYDADGKRVASD